MSNGESKIAESKAALCCGFAIALRALFLGDSLLWDSLHVDCFANARNDKWQCAFNRTHQYHNSSHLLDSHAPMRPFARGGENRVPFALERGGDILNRCAVIEQNLEQCAAWQL